MGCFLACFGFSHKRKIRKPAHKRYGSYKPLDSSSITIVRLSSSHKNPITVGDFEPRHKTKEQQQEQKPSSKIRKKVRFNLNVQTYEPVSTSYDNFLEKEEEIHDEKMEILSTSKGSFNLNYRYRNCSDFYDEEEEEEDMAFEDSDLYDDDYYNDDDEEDDDYDGDDDIDIERVSHTSSEKKVISCENTDGEKINSTTTSLHSVLKPVENINQWREAKAKTAPLKQQRKENIQLFRQSSSSCLSQQQQKQPFDYQSKPLLQEIAVDSSLSSWLTSKTIQSV
ncbi:uncharacterized protein LOC115722518 [Cannabis sativa]|uniref:uncharacterized protein LOC115722518 n=1 Tax=Cannabis sativa TaxID=3483 RepID=UPI0029CA5557|nr:uncharacterized protein LOC115722518 [Cannabis sativa]